jgi:hypothetical protein
VAEIEPAARDVGKEEPALILADFAGKFKAACARCVILWAARKERGKGSSAVLGRQP